MSTSVYHSPVLKTVAVDWLNIQPGEKYIDATLGGGNHTAEMIRRGAAVLGMDQDPDAISACLTLYPEWIESRHLVLVQTNFTHLASSAASIGWKPVAGVLFDLGVSMHQVETPPRGFSWAVDGPLDMRMDPTTAATAADLVNQLPERQLAELILKFGEENTAFQVAKRIVANRPIDSTRKLFNLIGRPDRARRVFQALRIAVNDELGAIQSGLPQALEVLKPAGRVVAISFHSLEDRLVKRQFVDWQSAKLGQILTHKPILGERGSKLRAFEKSHI